MDIKQYNKAILELEYLKIFRYGKINGAIKRKRNTIKNYDTNNHSKVLLRLIKDIFISFKDDEFLSYKTNGAYLCLNWRKHNSNFYFFVQYGTFYNTIDSVKELEIKLSEVRNEFLQLGTRYHYNLSYGRIDINFGSSANYVDDNFGYFYENNSYEKFLETIEIRGKLKELFCLYKDYEEKVNEILEKNKQEELKKEPIYITNMCPQSVETIIVDGDTVQLTPMTPPISTIIQQELIEPVTHTTQQITPVIQQEPNESQRRFNEALLRWRERI